MSLVSSAFNILKGCFLSVYALLPVNFHHDLMPLNKFWNVIKKFTFFNILDDFLLQSDSTETFAPPPLFRSVYPAWSFSRKLNIRISTAKSAGVRWSKGAWEDDGMAQRFSAFQQIQSLMATP